MADSIRGLFETVQRTSPTGQPYTIWRLKPAYWQTYPYFEVNGAVTPALLGTLENILVGYSRVTNSPGTVDDLSVFLSDLRNTPPVDPKLNEPSTQGFSFDVEFFGQDNGIGARVRDYEAAPVTGKPYDEMAKDYDSRANEFVPDARIKSNNVIRQNGVPKNLATDRIPASYFLNNFGIRDSLAHVEINFIHEFFHMALTEGPREANNVAPGHPRVYQTLLQSSGAINSGLVTIADVQADPVEARTFVVALGRGLIRNTPTDIAHYWAARRNAFAAALDKFVADNHLQTVAELNQKFDKTSASGGPTLLPDVGFDPTTGEVLSYVGYQIYRAAFGIDASDLGSALGSAIGRVIAGDNQIAQIVASSGLSSVLQNLGELFEGPAPDIQAAIGGTRETLERAIGADFLRNLEGQARGAVSSYLVGELAESLGIGGVAGDATVGVGGQVVSQVGYNLLHLSDWVDSQGTVVQQGTPGAVQRSWNTGIDASLFVNAVGSWIGGRLAHAIGNFDTVGGQLGAAVGQTYGAIRAAGFLSQFPPSVILAHPLLAIAAVAIIVFVDTLFGGLIGSLFGGTPKSGADLNWNANEFAVGRVWSKNGGSKDNARSLATSVAQVLNGVVAASGSLLLDPYGVRTGSYGTHGKKFRYTATSGPDAGEVTFETKQPDAVVNHGAALGVADLVPRLLGGDVFIKRAIATTIANANVSSTSSGSGASGTFDVNSLLGNIAVARDYAGYRSDPLTIQGLIALAPQSSFAAGWLVTFAKAVELGLDRRGSTDWIGGWAAFLDGVKDGRIDGSALTPANLRLELDAETQERLFVFLNSDGSYQSMSGDTIDNASKDSVLGTSGSDTISVVSGQLTSNNGFSVSGGSVGTAPFIVDVAAAIDGGEGNDVISGGDLGNDLLGGNGSDTLIGGKLDDWEFGGAGDDRLFSGNSNYQFSDSDPVGTAAALSANGGNGDYLDGGDGDDVLYGSTGSDWLQGGAGADRLYGGAGGDILAGGAGDDRGPNGEARIFGGAGTDQYLFNYGDGKDVIFDDADNSASPGSVGDSLYTRQSQINLGTLARNWAGGGNYEVDGSVKGGEDAVAFGPGITMQDIVLQRSGTEAAAGQDLIIKLTAVDPNSGARLPTGDELTIKDWFESTRRVEWLRFANGEEIRLGDIASFLVGTSGNDIIIGTSGSNFMVGGDGNDWMRGLAGDDFGFGGAGKDMVAGDEDNDLVSGGSDDDEVIGGDGNDTVFGDQGNDKLFGGNGSDLLAGGKGDDEVVGGAGDDVFQYERGDGRDTIMDDYVDNWEVVWQNNGYTNGYVLDPQTNTVSKNGEIVFNGAEWIGVYDYSDATKTMRRHLGAVNGATATNNGVDYIEFGVGIDIQDLMLHRSGADLQIAVATESSDIPVFDAATDRITLRDWYTTNGNAIENFAFAATGRHDITSWSMTGAGTDAADSITGTAGVDWITGNGGDDTIDGSDGADILAGNGGGDTIKGGLGDDIIYGGASDDILEGGAGADMLFGGTGVDTASYATTTSTAVRVFLGASWSNTKDAKGDTFDSIENVEGSTGADRLGGDDGGNVLRGLGGNDTLYGGAGDDIYEVDASNGQDTILDAPFTSEEIISETGVFNDTLYAATWNYTGYKSTSAGMRYCYQLVVTRNGTNEEVYRSRDTIDFIYSSGGSTKPKPAATSWPYNNGQWSAALGVTRTGNSTQTVRELFTNEDGGSDTLELGANISLSDLTFQRLNGNADLRITYASSNYVTITGQSDPTRAIETLQLRDGLSADLTKLVIVGETASSGDDLVVGDGNANTLDGGAGDDIISGAAGADILYGGAGDDTLEGGAGGDTLDGGTDSITDGTPISADDMTRPYGDTIRYVRSTAAVTIDLAARTASGGHAASDVIVAVNGVSTIENVVGSDGYNDTLRGDSRANRLFGLGGNDTMDGRAGNDVLVGGLGNDNLTGGDGEDNLAGEDGDDTLNGGNDKDLLAGGAGIDILNGDAGEDVLSGGDGNDTLHGGSEADIVGGDAGDDVLYGDAGDDQIAGGDGNDTLSGGDGNDILVGEAGNDTLQGELGDDTYVFDARSDSDTLVDASGINQLVIEGVSTDQVWLVQSGNDLKVSVIGGTTMLTVQNFYATGSPTLVRSIALEDQTLYLSGAGGLITAMTASSTGTPAVMPSDIAAVLGDYWIVGTKAPPMVDDQSLNTDEDTALVGSVGAVDMDGNITGYALSSSASFGSVALNAATGGWTYTPQANYHGTDSFSITVTDGDNQSATQTISVDIASVNDAPSDITLSGAPSGITERDHPISGTALDPILLGTLSATDVDAPDTGDFASHVFSVADSRFEIVNGNQLRLKAGVALDYEAATSVTVAVTATDRNGAGLSYVKNFTFNVLDGDDYFYGTAGADALTGQAGRNLIYGYGGNDTLNGAAADDVLDGGDGIDALNGGGGNDSLTGGLGDDVMDGGSGNDMLSGGDGADTLQGGDGTDTLYGDFGNDTLRGGLLADQLDGGAGNDRLEGDAGDDRLVGGTEDDILIGGAGADRFLSGAGYDTVSYETATAGVTVNLATLSGSAGDASGDVFEDLPERLLGSAYADTLTGSSGNDLLEGGAGDDLIYGGYGNDTLLGGDGNDTLDAQWGNDTLDGGIGSDILIGGDDSDTYLINVSSGTDEIRNFDPNGTDIDVIGYQNIDKNQLWFERIGNDLLITVVGTGTSETVKDWYVITNSTDRSNYKIDFFLASGHVTQTINAEALVTLMAGYTKPTTQGAYNTLHANSSFENPWNAVWSPNAPPTVPAVATQAINEDGSLSLSVTITDDFTPAAGVVVTAATVGAGDANLVNAPTISAPDANGTRTLTVTSKPNASGSVTVRLTATDGGGLSTQRDFQLNINPIPDVPIVTLAVPKAPPAPATKSTLEYGALGIDLQAALVDQDGSETLAVQVSGVPGALSFSAGTNLGGGVWSFTPAQLSNLTISGPSNFSQNVALAVTATSRETATGQVSSASTPQTLTITFNAKPTDIVPGGLTVNEGAAYGTVVGTFTRTDPDSGEGDSATYSLIDSAGGKFAISTGGTLTTTTVFDRETMGSSGTSAITVRVTDSGGLYFDKSFIVTVADVNESPSMGSGNYTFSVNENMIQVAGTVSASDPDVYTPAYQNLQYELVGAPAMFGIVSNTGQIYLNSTLNYEASQSYSFQVRARDGAGAYTPTNSNVTVNVVNQNDPTYGYTTSALVPENIGGPYSWSTGLKFVASDEDGPVTFQVLNGSPSDPGNPNVFTLASDGTLYAHQMLDYESRIYYTVNYRMTDPSGNYQDATATITVGDARDSAPVLSFSPRAQGASGSWVGHATAYDADVGSVITYHITDQEQYRNIYARMDESMYYDSEGWTSLNGTASITSSGDLYADYFYGMQDLTAYPYDYYWEYYTTVHLTIAAQDETGRWSNPITIELYPQSIYIVPIALDLDSDGIELVPQQTSTAKYNVIDGEPARRVGWVGADDGLLVLDRNKDGVITERTEISFVDDVEGASTDLEGLSAFDTNEDGYLDAGDARYAEFQVWQDRNQDGVSQTDELQSLAASGIRAIGLTRELTGQTVDSATDNVITATGELVRDNGSVAQVGDVALAYTDLQVRVVDSPDAPVQRPDALAAPAGSEVDESPQRFSKGDLQNTLRNGSTGHDAHPADDGATRGDVDIGEVDRHSNNKSDVARNEPSAVQAPGDFESKDVQAPEEDEWKAAATRRLRQRNPDNDEELPSAQPRKPAEERYASAPPADSEIEVGAGEPARGALHTPLDLVARRRLQMIDAIAGFSNEGSVMLELMPQRRVDARTLELLTTVANTRAIA